MMIQKNLQSMLKFTYDYYPGLQYFQLFIRNKYSKKKIKFFNIGNKRIKRDVLKLQSKFSKKHETEEEKTSKCSKMVFDLIKKLEEAPNFQKKKTITRFGSKYPILFQIEKVFLVMNYTYSKKI